MQIFYLRAVIFSLLSLANFSILHAQQERINNYEVQIEINEDRSITVTEDINVYAAGESIQRGITRSLPRRRLLQNRQQGVRYEIIEVRRDGRQEPFHVQNEGEFKVLYIGDANIFLDPGNYEYTIVYRVPNQIGLFEEYDELYWNAIGNDVSFPIDQASCTIRLPGDARSVQAACYTGPYGSQDQDCTSTEQNGGKSVFFRLTEPLAPYEGFSVAVGFDKGVVEPPTFLERFGAALLIGAGALGLLIYFIYTWYKYGIDPPRPVPYPIFAPPGELSPAALNYIHSEKYQSNSITSSIIDLAIKGYLRIDERKEKGFFTSSTVYDLTLLKSDSKGLVPEEKALLDRLFSGSSTVTIDGEYDAQIKRAYDAHQSSVKAQYEDFVKEGSNTRFIILPILVTIVVAVISIVLINRNGGNLEGMGLVLFALAFILFPVFGMFNVFKSRARFPGLLKVFIVPFLGVFIIVGALPLLLGSSQLGSEILENLSGPGVNLIALLLFIPLAIVGILVYTYLIKKPTTDKLKLQSEIEGFKMYLEMAEEDRLNILNPPERTPELFEAMLPFAFALGVQHKWSKLFKDILDKAMYQPTWSNTPHIYTSNSFSSDFSRSMASSSTPPSSSSGSGSGGGGFSGGGGGGGGVGGW